MESSIAKNILFQKGNFWMNYRILKYQKIYIFAEENSSWTQQKSEKQFVKFYAKKQFENLDLNFHV